MSAEVVDNVPADEVKTVCASLLSGGALKVVQNKNPEGSYRLSVFREHAYDLFISYATEDFELCVSDFVQNLWRHGITSIWWDRMSVGYIESIPQKVDEGLRRSKYLMCILTDKYYQKFWTREELDAVTMQKKRVIPIWVDTNAEAVTAFSPRLAAKKAIIYDGDPNEAMSIVAGILSKDLDTEFYHRSASRKEKIAFWGMVWLYVQHALGILERKHDLAFAKVSPGENWKAHVEHELGIDKKKVLAVAAGLDGFTVEEKSYLVLAVLKRGSDGWFPTYDIELELLRKAKLSDW